MRRNDRADPASCEPFLEVYPRPRPGAVVVVDASGNARANEPVFDSQTADKKRLEYRLNVRRLSALHLVSIGWRRLHNAQAHAITTGPSISALRHLARSLRLTFPGRMIPRVQTRNAACSSGLAAS